jgi:hypothetical protein
MPRITKRAVDGARPHPDRDRYVWDSDVRGFGLRVKPSGRKSYFVRYRSPSGRERRITLGQHGRITPDQARKLAQQVFGRVAAGEDPAEQRTGGITCAELAERYFSEHAELKKKPSSVKADRTNMRNHVIPNLGRMRVSQVTRADVEGLHHEMRETPGAANRTLALLSKMFRLAERWGLRSDGTNPCQHVERYPERPRSRYLADDELRRLGVALEECGRDGSVSPEAISAIRLIALTGCRVSEILTVEWSFVDWQLQVHAVQAC